MNEFEVLDRKPLIQGVSRDSSQEVDSPCPLHLAECGECLRRSKQLDYVKPTRKIQPDECSKNSINMALDEIICPLIIIIIIPVDKNCTLS